MRTSIHRIADSAAIIIFGGGNGNRALNDTHVLDLSNPERLEWRVLETKGPRPLSRGYHTMTLVNNKAVVYGGSGMSASK